MEATGRKNSRLRTGLQIVLLLAVILMAAGGIRLAWRAYYRSAYPVHYSTVVLAEGERNALPPSLVYAVIRTESGFDPNAVSHVEARGLMQITEDTFHWTQYRLGEQGDYDFDDLFDGDLNVRYGTAILRLLLDEFGSVENALCAYHAGWGSVTGWLNNPEYSADGVTIDHIPFGDTRRYVKRVLETQEMYRRLYDMD